MSENITSYDYKQLITEVNKSALDFYKNEYLGERPADFDEFRNDLIKMLQSQSGGTNHELYNMVKEAVENQREEEKYPFMSIYNNDNIYDQVHSNYLQSHDEHSR